MIDMNKKTVAFETLGCKVNFAETEKLKSLFEEEGFEVVGTDTIPDFFIVNSCTVTSKAEKDCRKIIRRMKKNSPETYVAVVGCSPEFQKENNEKFADADAVFGQQEKYSAHLKLIGLKEGKEKAFFINTCEEKFIPASSSDPENRSRAFIKLQDGCDYYCSYCAVAHARGSSRSMPFDEIIPEMQKIYDKGFRETVISGINLGTYNYEGKKLIDVLKTLEESDIRMRYRISSIEPNLLTDEIIDYVAKSEKICHHFHIPLQAGSDEVLKDMRRRYTTSRFFQRIERIKTAMPHCGIGIDVITGFPSETDELFENGVEFLKSLPFSYLHVFSYSVRPDTPAAKMKNLVTPGEAKKRTAILNAISDEKKNEFYRSQIGNRGKVIAEYKENADYAMGWTENYVRVKFPAYKPGKEFISVKLKSVENDIVIAEEM
jgi:threonylcarbamoyladenosine tRNA methylthiotransferase MtaB